MPVGIAVSGEKSVHMFAPIGDHLIAVEPDEGLVRAWQHARQATGLPGHGRVIGQIPVSWDPDGDTAVKRAHDQFRWFAGGWHVNADLPTTAGFAAATQFVRPGGRGGEHSVRAGSRRDRRRRPRVLGGRVHRHRLGADR